MSDVTCILSQIEQGDPHSFSDVFILGGHLLAAALPPTLVAGQDATLELLWVAESDEPKGGAVLSLRRTTNGPSQSLSGRGLDTLDWNQVLAKAELSGRVDVGALRLRTVATKDRPCADFPLKVGDGDDPAVLLELDYWVLLPR